MMAGHRPNRHHPGILDEAMGEPPSEAGSELVVVLEVTFLTVPTAEPPVAPYQSGAPARHPQVTDPLRSPVPHPLTAEPALRAPRPLPSRFHLDLRAVNRIDWHRQHADTRQPQTNGHNIKHSEASWHRRVGTSPIPARPHPNSKDFTPPNPRFRAGPAILSTDRGVSDPPIGRYIIEVAPFFYRIYRLPPDAKVADYLGMAFPIVENGGLLTCRHVVDLLPNNDDLLFVHDNEQAQNVVIEQSNIVYPAHKSLDIAYLPDALQRTKPEFLPMLTPSKITMGEDVYSMGYYLEGGGITPTPGYFGGTIVNPAVWKGHGIIRVSYPLLEGFSGTPVLTYHNGTKLVGIGFGNVQSRIVAAQTLDYKDETRTVSETINRITEFGQAYHTETIINFAEEASIAITVTDQRVNLPELG